MISGIFEILKSIGDFFVSIGEFVGSFFTDLVEFIKLLSSITTQITSFMGGLPVFFVAGVSALLVVMILLRVLGRD